MTENYMKDYIASLKEVFAKNNCGEAYSIYEQVEGAPLDEINSFEKDFGILLPEDFKEYYKIKNGSGACTILYTPEFNNFNTYLLLPLEDIRALLTMSAFSTRKLLPFAVAGMGGNSLSHGVYAAFDFYPRNSGEKGVYLARNGVNSAFYSYPAENGKKGQILRYVSDDHKYIDCVAATFTELLEKSKNNFENNVQDNELRARIIDERLQEHIKRILERSGRSANTFDGF